MRSPAVPSGTATTTPSAPLPYDLQNLHLVVCFFYQVVLDLVYGHVTRAEALLRVLSSDRRIAGPAELLQTIRAAGAEDLLTRLTIDMVTADAARLRATGLPLQLCANFSPQQLTAALPEQLENAMRARGLPPIALGIEVTEESALGPESYIALEGLVRRGFKLIKDDVGAGVADLVVLARVPFAGIKLDREIVTRAVAREPTGMAIARAVGALAREVGAYVVAEGIESRERAVSQILSLGIREGQGFGLAVPMPLESLRDLLVRGADGRVYLAGEVSHG